ncbi:hypothetical protein V7113_30360, partial [Priestia megaterium]|uniref:hypothetical protein n=1 Tax=Priestia megaterium TaxID=1404 RepID=UPI002FFFF314
AIEEIIKDNKLLQAGYDEGIIDFFTTQLHIWIQKIKLRGNSFFNKDDVYNLENDYKSSHPSWYFTRLNSLIMSFLEKLCKLELLEKKIEKSEENEEVIYYRWTEQATIKTEMTLDTESVFQSQFLSNFIEFENLLRVTYEDIFKEKKLNQRPSLVQMIKSLNEVGIDLMRSIKTRGEYVLEPIIDLRNRIVHGETITLQDLDNAHMYDNHLKRVRDYLNEEYTYWILKEHLSYFNYSVRRPVPLETGSNYTFDYEALHDTNDKSPGIVFSVRNYGNVNAGSFKSFIFATLEALNQYRKTSSKPIYLVFIFLETNMSSSKRKMLEDAITNRYPHLESIIMTLFIPKNQDFSKRQTISTALDNLLEKVSKTERVRNILQ